MILNPKPLTRRSHLQRVAALPLAAALPAWMPRLSFAPQEAAPRGDTLVVVFLRGAADALNIVVPHGEDVYYDMRPTIAIPRPDDARQAQSLRSVDLDGFFGLHPALDPLTEAWQGQHLGIVHACGAPDESRSHFQAMELMERGVESRNGPASGWIGRHLATYDTGNRSPLRAVGFGDLPQRSIRGPVPISAVRSIADFHFKGEEKLLARMMSGLNALYSGDDSVSSAGQETLGAMDILQKLDLHSYQPKGDRAYPESNFGLALKQVAMLVKAEVGLEVAAVDLDGWDTHFVQGSSEGLMAGGLRDLGAGLAALHSDLFDHADRLTVVAMSEFGRRLKENGSFGTDHGHGGAMLLLGGNVAGGAVHGDWPGLADEQLIGPGDLAVTTDYRDVLGELCSKRLNNQALTEIFPDYQVTMRGFFDS